MKLKSLLIGLCLLIVFSSKLFAQSNLLRSQKLKAFQETTQAQSTISNTTLTANFIRFPKNQPLSLTGNSLKEKSSNFIQTHGAILGFRPDEDQLQFQQTRTDKHGRKHLIYQQHYQGVPIYDGRLNFHFNENSKLSAINGNFIPQIKLNPVPAINAATAATIAKELVQTQFKDVSIAELFVHQQQLYIFNKGLARGTEAANALVHEVEIRNGSNIREFVFVDAQNGSIVEQYTGMAHALSRRLYEDNTGNQIWQEGDAFPAALDNWQQNELVAAAHTYYFFEHAFGWTSYDNADAEMQTINNNPGISCPNATWNGTTANYCTGTASDDVVAHEWGHAYTEFTSGLIYAFQSGALNESFSDIWGETIDLLNAYEDADEDHSLRSGCSSSDRWRVGEDATAFGGAIRDMWDPTCDGHPAKVSDAVYSCGDADSGGVHSNSGVPNHAYALLVDGGTYNGQTINGIGFIKAAHIFWLAQSVYLTKTSDFAVFADALESACTDLIGINLEGLSTTSVAAGPSGEIITTADYDELVKALIAVELRTEPEACGYAPMFATAPDLCNGAYGSNAIFFEDFESGFGSWSITQVPSNPATWDARDWVLDNTPPDNRAGTVAYGTNSDFGDCAADLDNGIIRMESPVINIPAGTPGTILMAFDHYVSTEDTWDGGNIKYALNGGSWTLLPASAFTANAYNKSLKTSAEGNNNPLESQDAFSGADEGSVSGTWGQSQIDLSTLGVAAGNSVQFRWEMGTDGCNGWDGWYIDDVRVYTCSVPVISFLNSSSQVAEAAANISNSCHDYTEHTITVKIDYAPSAATTINFIASTGTATEGSNADFSFTPASVVLDAGNLSETITVRVYNDAVVDDAEVAEFSYTIDANGGDARAGTVRQIHSMNIADDDYLPTSYPAILLSEGFEAGLGSFTTSTSGSAGFSTGDAATASSFYYDIQSTNNSQFAFVNDDDCNCDMSEVRLISPTLDLSQATSAMLTFDHAFSDINTEAFDLIVSTDGGNNWSGSILSLTNNSVPQGSGSVSVPWVTGITVDLTPYVGNANTKIAFQYNDAGAWAYGAAVDNVTVNVLQNAAVHTSVNVGVADEQYLGPLQTVYFYDPGSGAVMAKIKNLSSHDYGCTTVSVMRAGTGAEEAWSSATSDFITSKAFQVTPSNNNSAGSYEMTVYYTEAEISGWETATGKNRTELQLLKTTNDITNPQPGDPKESASVTVGSLGTDLTYMATFNTGFSSFASGPITALPVDLIAFTGRQTSDGILLNWQTASEKNNAYFNVERSFDGLTYEAIGQVEGKGTSATINEYEFLDRNYQQGHHYYRLKQVDHNGHFEYSRILLLNVTTSAKIECYPNPVEEELTIHFQEDMRGERTLRIYDVNGTLLKEKSLDLNEEKIHQADLRSLVSGVYWINIIGGERIYWNKIIRSKQ